MQPLTKRQTEIFTYIKDFLESSGFAPSYREIAAHFKLSSIATVADHIEALRSKGYLEQEVNQARSLTLTHPTKHDTPESEWVGVPLFGLIAAGKPIETAIAPETIDIPRDMLGKQTYALRVKGESMISDGILSGDYVIIEHTNVAKNGDIVVALLDQSTVTLKRFYREEGRIRLQPANPHMSPIYVTSVTIQGKVKGLIRKF
jgi:repressor LexA